MKKKGEILISAVIASYNGSDYIIRCLQSFTSQTLIANDFEVIVVNNNSTDNTTEIVENFISGKDNFKLVHETAQGVSHARNKGISIARGKYISFIDDDAYADNNWLERILAAFESVSPTPAVVGGKILPYYISKKPNWFSDDLETRTNGEKARFLAGNKAPFGFPESNYSVRKEILSEVGNFSTTFGPVGQKMAFGEGADLSRKINAKYPHFWYDPSIYVYHLVPPGNMRMGYILTRKYRTASSYQTFASSNSGFLRNVFDFSQCFARVFINLFCSLFCVNWLAKKAITKWLCYFIVVVNCTARSISVIKNMFGLLR